MMLAGDTGAVQESWATSHQPQKHGVEINGGGSVPVSRYVSVLYSKSERNALPQPVDGLTLKRDSYITVKPCH